MQNSLRLSYYKRLGKNEPTQYIFNQESSDQQLSTLLNLLTEFDSAFQLGQYRKSKQITKKMSTHLAKIDSRHRSFWKAKSLVLGCCILVLFEFQQFLKAYELMYEENQCSKHINSNQYIAKSYLFRILYLMVKPVEFLQEKIMNCNEVQVNYKKFSKIKLYSSVAYFDSRLWEQFMLLQILVYQYILIVQKLAEFDEVKATYLYTKGLKITQNLLGKQHKFTIMMNRITRIRKQTNKLLRMQSLQTSLSSTSMFNQQNKSNRSKKKDIKKRSLLKSTSNKRNYTQMDKSKEPNNFSSSLYKTKTLHNSDSLWAVKKIKKNKIMDSHDKQCNMQIDKVSEDVSKFQQEESINEQKPEFKSIFTRKKKRQFLFKRGGFIINQQTLLKQRQQNLKKMLNTKIGRSQELQIEEQQPKKKTIVNLDFKQQQKQKQQLKVSKQIIKQNPQNQPKQPDIQKTKRPQTPHKIPKIKSKKQDTLEQSDWSCQLI